MSSTQERALFFMGQVKIYLKKIDETRGKRNKAMVCSGLFEYIAENQWIFDLYSVFGQVVAKKMEQFYYQEPLSREVVLPFDDLYQNITGHSLRSLRSRRKASHYLLIEEAERFINHLH